ncbi:MAG: isoprenyl transferase [Lachnospiraceae bacterium]|nr:isoprenyl transferase [Lachnospiraceae bacterium]
MGDIINSDGRKIPEHVAIILDGNGRWAKKRFLPRNAGHVQGAANIEKVCTIARDMGIKYVTVYAFSTENWKRPSAEVEAIMKLLRQYLKDCRKKCKKNNMKVRVIGDISVLDEDFQNTIKDLVDYSKEHTGLNFTVALNYGSRDEIRRAFKEIMKEHDEGKISLDDIDEKLISDHLDTRELPDPDLVIRTSGEQRMSNYMMWQIAYSEFYFTDTLWPDFSKKDLEAAVDFYNKVDRRFGGIKS